MVVELDLHNYRPDIHPDVQDNNREKTDLGAATLAETLHVQDETETKAANTSKRRDKLMRVVEELSCTETYMQKKGEMRDERARARTEK
jgi:hypothetical protein